MTTPHTQRYSRNLQHSCTSHDRQWTDSKVLVAIASSCTHAPLTPHYHACSQPHDTRDSTAEHFIPNQPSHTHVSHMFRTVRIYNYTRSCTGTGTSIAGHRTTNSGPGRLVHVWLYLEPIIKAGDRSIDQRIKSARQIVFADFVRSRHAAFCFSLALFANLHA